MPDTTKDRLETMLDNVGLTALLDMLGEVCHEKAEHIRTNWQDEGNAKTWDRAAKVCERAVTASCKPGVALYR